MKATIGLLGVGRMGLPICANLVRAGYQVIAGDRQLEREADVRATGASWAGDTRLVAAAADVLITVLSGSDELREGMAVAIPGLRPGTTWIDMTSTSVAVGRELAGRARERGIECLEAPIGGGPTAATAGALQLFVGGRAETVERCRGLLEVLGSVDHVGDQGAGYTTKLLVNLLWFGQAVASGEALLVARRAGIDLEVLCGVLGRSAAASEFIRRDLDELLDGDYLESFGLDRCCEELESVVALARELEVPFELSAQVARAYGRALERYGHVDGELLAVALLEERAGVLLRRIK
jgi:3-hydroxyisobutyrate dehydrogenase-like beta-hydroxyacid dehydrogenase